MSLLHNHLPDLLPPNFVCGRPQMGKPDLRTGSWQSGQVLSSRELAGVEVGFALGASRHLRLLAIVRSSLPPSRSTIIRVGGVEVAGRA